MKQHQQQQQQQKWQPWSAVRFGQVQSSQSMPPATTCHNCNVLHAMLPLWCRLWLWSSLSACGCCIACLPAACLPACPCSSSGLSGIAHDTHLGNVQCAACNAIVVLPMREREREMERALCLFGYFMPFAMGCLCLSPPPPHLPACLIIKMTKYLEKIINFVCMFGKIISRRYKVPFMSCLYLLSPSREQKTKKTFFLLAHCSSNTAAAADASPTCRWQLK